MDPSATGLRSHSSVRYPHPGRTAGTILRRRSFMRNISRSIFVLLALSLFSGASAVRAQDAAKKTKTPSEAVLEGWNDVGNRLMAMAQDWAEDKYTSKLTP